MKRRLPVINKKSANIIRIAGFVVPFVLVFYAVLAALGIVDRSHINNPVAFNLTLLSWSILTLFHLFLDTRNRTYVKYVLSAYHLLIIPYAVFVSGVISPFLVGWLILFLASYIYFGNRGLKYSAGALVLIVVCDLLAYDYDTDGVIRILFTLVSELFVGVVILALTRVQEVDWVEFMRSKEEGVVQRQRIEIIINNLTEAVLGIDSDGIIQVYNAATLNLLDTNQTLTGRHIDDVTKIYDYSKKRVHMLAGKEKTLLQPTVRDDLTMYFEDEPIKIELTRTPIHASYGSSKEITGYVVILRDITRAKSLEEERDEFISVVSHELRTPLAIAEGSISNLQFMLDKKEVSKDALAQPISSTHDQIVFLSRLVNDLSTLSRAERGVADAPERIDVSEMIHDLYKEYAPRAERSGLRFNLDAGTGLGTVYASRLYLKEMLQNFITNSIKYTKEGSVTLHVAKSKGLLNFAVKDTGIGISKNDLEKIFDKFYRSEDYRTRETRGTGLGLYVTTKLADKLDTKIEVESRLNHGSTFSFSLPEYKKRTKN